MEYVFYKSIAFLSSKTLLNYYLNGRLLDKHSINTELFFLQRDMNKQIPNQMYENILKCFDQQGVYSSLCKSLDDFQCFLDYDTKTEKLHIKNSLETWQLSLIHLNPLPLIVYNLLKKNISKDKIREIFNVSTLASPRVKSLEDNQFRELHIHINGTSESIFNWLHFLENQKDTYEIVKASYDQNAKQYRQLGIHDQRELSYIIERASTIREYLKELILDPNLRFMLENDFFQKWRAYLNINSFASSPYGKKVTLNNSKSNNRNRLKEEAEMWYSVFQIMEEESPYFTIQENLSSLVHFYLLAMSIFNKFLVQQSDQNGFSQFQLITDNELRDSYENEGFRERYLQLDGMYKGEHDLKHAEIRFAPKKNVSKMIKLYKRLIQDYNSSKEKNLEIFSISTVAHFIKQKDEENENKSLSCMHASLRRNLQKQAYVLITMFESSRAYFLKTNINYLDYFVGIDAAGNELYARPEIFAPVFNNLNMEFKKRFSKKLNLTFHAGEDFVHLMSGIRYIWEAIHFLKMKDVKQWHQCRIGHATALGINPKYWAGKVNKLIVMSKGEYLDNIFFAKYYLGTEKYDVEIKKIYSDIYSGEYNYEEYLEAFMLRGEDPYTCDNILIKEYNNGMVQQRYHNMISVNIDDTDIDLMLQCQYELLKSMKEYNIAIESMITSNVRISFYEHYAEHHIFRWLFPEGNETNIMPPIVLASDNPGLFNTNMRLEFSHLYEMLKHKKTESDIVRAIELLQKNADSFSFKV